MRVPVVIYNDLSKAEEVALFMDINTKQRPVPGELILAIKHMAEREEDWETLLRKAFDLFDKEPDSPLFGLLSSTEKMRQRISRKAFNLALKPILNTFEDKDPESMYEILKAYLHAWMAGLRACKADHNIVNTTLFKAIILVFPAVAERVSNKYDGIYSAENFREVLSVLFSRVRKSHLQEPGAGSRELSETFKTTLQSGFSIGKR